MNDTYAPMRAQVAAIADAHPGWSVGDGASIVHDDYSAIVDLHFDESGLLHYCAIGESWTDWDDLISALEVDQEYWRLEGAEG